MSHYTANQDQSATRSPMLSFTRPLSRVLCLISLVFGSLISLSPTAHAEDLRVTKLSEQDDESRYFLGRFSLVVPDNSTRMITTSSVGFGAVSEDKRHAYGLRFTWIPNPTENPIADDGEEYIKMDHAIGPLFDWRFFLNPNSKMTFYTVTSIGFAFGTPDQDSKDHAKKYNLDEPTNQIVPLFELGVGVFLSKKFGAKNEVFLNPEFGIVPGISAPFLSLSAGINL